MRDYKETLQLPQTAFPMKANLPKRELDILQHWRAIELYRQLRTHNQGKPVFKLLDGPPYANGHLHLGHAVNKIIKDIILKAKTFSGYDAPFIPGWDCHGLPIELNVEKQLQQSGSTVDEAEFRAQCRTYAAQQIDIQREEFIRLGVLGDWQNPYRTMDFACEANIIRHLATILRQGHVKRGYKPVYWCLNCRSALAEAEVEYQEKRSLALDVRFIVADPQDICQRFALPSASLAQTISVVIWTTTPWTLPANQAVAVHPECEYVVVEGDNKECFIVAEALLEQVAQRYSVNQYSILGKVIGKQLEAVVLHHPFYARSVPIILSDHVTMDAGTGAVHIAPAHGEEDFALSETYHLPVDDPLDQQGRFRDSMPLVGGLTVEEAQDVVFNALCHHHTLRHKAIIVHSYPHCWRHKTPLIFRATPQWFISMTENHLRDCALAAVDQVQWLPHWGQTRMHRMITQRPDWCISRQRIWGVPLVAFIHKDTGAWHPRTVEWMEEIATRVSEQGIEAWHQLKIEDLLGEEATYYQKSKDVLDVWFDSGVMHSCLSVYGSSMHTQLPFDLVLEGTDQYRGWFQSMLLSAVGMYKEAPYRSVLTHGFVVDGEGRKMSKSIGNVMTPQEIIQHFGADIVRLWVASVDYHTDITVSQEILQRTVEMYRRIRNTVRFLLANLGDFTPEKHAISIENCMGFDRWILHQAHQLQKDHITAYDLYQFHSIVQKIHHFCVVDLGGFYLDVIKDRLYTLPQNSPARRSAQTALFHLVHALVRWLAPILSFTAEEIWRCLPGATAESVFLTTWYTDLPMLPIDSVMNAAYWEDIRRVRDAVNKELEQARQAGHIGSALAAEVHLYCTAEWQGKLAVLQEELRFVLLTSCAILHSEQKAKQPPFAEEGKYIETELPGLAVYIKPSSHAKCVRCWHRCLDTNTHVDYPDICGRCVSNIVSPQGEQRCFV